MHRVSLTELDRAVQWANEHRAVLREAGDHWVATGEWMTVTELGRSAMRREDAADVFRALRNFPPALGRVNQPEDTVQLRVRALATTPSAESRTCTSSSASSGWRRCGCGRTMTTSKSVGRT